MKKSLWMTPLFTLLIQSSLAWADPPTQVIIYQAYSRDNVLNPNLVIAQRYTGSCTTHSVANPSRIDAWCCQASNVTLDPCFEDGTSLACVASPWSQRAAVLELNKPLYKIKNQKKFNPLTDQPWAFQLIKGPRCTFLTGASSIIKNMRINYTCDNAKYSVIGDIDRSSATWKVKLYDFDRQEIENEAIRTVWF